jgi:hypothetical protein
MQLASEAPVGISHSSSAVIVTQERSIVAVIEKELLDDFGGALK